MLEMIFILFLCYIMYSVLFYIVEFEKVLIFFKYIVPDELLRCSEKYKIKNKTFEYIVIILCLIILPFNFSIRREK